MKRFIVAFEWTFYGVDEVQKNTFPIYASSDVNALNIGRSKINTIGKVLNVSPRMISETVKGNE